MEIYKIKVKMMLDFIECDGSSCSILEALGSMTWEGFKQAN